MSENIGKKVYFIQDNKEQRTSLMEVVDHIKECATRAGYEKCVLDTVMKWLEKYDDNGRDPRITISNEEYMGYPGYLTVDLDNGILDANTRIPAYECGLDREELDIIEYALDPHTINRPYVEIHALDIDDEEEAYLLSQEERDAISCAIDTE